MTYNLSTKTKYFCIIICENTYRYAKIFKKAKIRLISLHRSACLRFSSPGRGVGVDVGFGVGVCIYIKMVLETVRWICFIFGTMIDIGPRFLSAISCTRL